MLSNGNVLWELLGKSAKCGMAASCSLGGLALIEVLCAKEVLNRSMGVLYDTVEYSKGDQDDWCDHIQLLDNFQDEFLW